MKFWNTLDRNIQQETISEGFVVHPEVDGIFASDDLLAALVVVAEAQK